MKQVVVVTVEEIEQVSSKDIEFPVGNVENCLDEGADKPSMDETKESEDLVHEKHDVIDIDVELMKHDILVTFYEEPNTEVEPVLDGIKQDDIFTFE